MISGTLPVVTIPRTCCRCGAEFRTVRKRVCPACEAPKHDYYPRAATLLGQALTPRERQLAGLVAEAHANKEIAARLHLTEGTIKEYLHTVMRKLGLSNRVSVALWYLRQ